MQPPTHNPRAAIAYMLSATLFIATATLMAKLAGDARFGTPLHPLQASHGRFLFGFLTIALIFALRGQPFQSPAYKTHALRSALGWGGVTLMFTAVTFIPMADATALSFLNPIFAMILAIPILGERVGPLRWLAAAIALAGALILLRPSAASFQLGGLFGVGAALFMGGEIVLVKLLTGRERPLQILVINNAIGVTLASLAVLPVWQLPSAAQWLILAATGLSMITAQFLFVMAMARAEASFITPFAFCTLIWAAAYDAALFAKWPDAVTLLGAAVILGGALLLAARDTKAYKPDLR